MTTTQQPYRKCRKCAGTGYLANFAHVAQGQCFSCGGTGNSSPVVKPLSEDDLYYQGVLEARIARLEAIRARLAAKEAS